MKLHRVILLTRIQMIEQVVQLNFLVGIHSHDGGKYNECRRAFLKPLTSVAFKSFGIHYNVRICIRSPMLRKAKAFKVTQVVFKKPLRHSLYFPPSCE